MKPGFLYIISNPSFPGFLKIGVSEDINARLHTYQTGDPKRSYKVEYYIFHPDCYKAEKKIKEMMKRFATSQRKEWFEVSLAVSKVRLDESLDDYNNDPEKY